MKPYLCLALLGAAVAGPWWLRSPAAPPGNVTIAVTRDAIDFKVGAQLVGRYHIAPTVAKPYFWPLNGPDGLPVTRAWPMVKGQPGESTDHVHQKSAWFCHGDVIPEGLELTARVKGVAGVDFWSEARNAGRIVCTHVGEPRLGSTHGDIPTRNEWRTADGTKILDETRTLHLYNLDGARLIVLDIDLQATVVPITFGDTKEGALGIRISDQITEKSGKGRLENAEGQTGERQVWGRVSAWCDYSGPIGDRVVGLAILDDPTNPYPACWHSRGYGLMAANPFGRARSGFPAMKGKTDLVKLARGEHLKLRYGLLIHPGDARTGNVAAYYQQFLKVKG